MSLFSRKDRKCHTLLIAAALAAAFFMFAATAVAAGPNLSERQTSWRAGDFIHHMTGCHDVGNMLAFARSGGTMDTENCFRMKAPLPAVLIEFVAGPFMNQQAGLVGSVWKIKGALQAVEFIWLDDRGGPHQPIRLQSL